MMWSGWTAVVLLIFTSCAKHQDDRRVLSMDRGNLKEDLLLLQTKRIYFGHQSVGEDIMNGLRSILRDNSDVRLNLVTAKGAVDLPENFFLDSFVGENRRTDLKCADFTRAIESLAGGRLDIAMLKFCFADIQRETNIQEIFERYTATIDSLKKRHPAVTFVHVTVPLSAGTTGLKRLVNTLLGRVGNNDMANLNRQKFSALLKARYRGEPVFDLASIESTYPDGTRESTTYGGETSHSMIAEYAAEDGDHLNEKGRELAAGAMIRLLADIARKK
jgi:hypothetical protein